MPKLLTGDAERRAGNSTGDKVNLTSELSCVITHEMPQVLFVDCPCGSVMVQRGHGERVVVDECEVLEAGLFHAEGLPAASGAQLQTLEVA